jgi:GNAT superfamily N-acetyltransferase
MFEVGCSMVDLHQQNQFIFIQKILFTIVIFHNLFFKKFMNIQIIKTSLEEIQALRSLFLYENNFQFIYNKCHGAGWADTYVFIEDAIKIGYGSVWGKDKREDRDAIFEFYLIKPFRRSANIVFPEFITACGATYIESQSNDLFLSTMLYQYAQNINAEAILFEEHFQSTLHIPGTIFRKQQPEDNPGDEEGYILEHNSTIVATGGFVKNYNMPFIDMYMEVKEPFRKKGFGSLMIQELKKEAYLLGRVPAARCNIKNNASKATLLKAGLRICGFILTGSIKKNGH